MRLTLPSNGMGFKAGTSFEFQSGSEVDSSETQLLNAHSTLSARATNVDVRGQSVKFRA